ncbi:MAG: hypothetical protein ACK4HD_04995 [Pannonibacter phragmitetus]
MLLTANNATSTLAASITNSATTISVQTGDASRFPEVPAGDWFPLFVIDTAGNSEIMRCTARAGAILTVERGQEATTPKHFASGSRVEVRLTSAAIDQKWETDTARGAAVKGTLSNDDRFPILDSAAGLSLKSVLWSTIKSFIDSAIAALNSALLQTINDTATALNGSSLQRANNLSDINSAEAARANLSAPSIAEMNAADALRLPVSGGTMTGTLYSTAGSPLRFKNVATNDNWTMASNGGVLLFHWDAAGGNGIAGDRFLLEFNTGWATLISTQAGGSGRLKFSCSWGNRSVFTDSSAIGFLDGTGSWNFYVTDTGVVWTKELGYLSTFINNQSYAVADSRGLHWANNRIANLQYRLVSYSEGYGTTVPNGAVMVGFETAGFMRWRYPQIFDPVRGWVGFSVA